MKFLYVFCVICIFSKLQLSNGQEEGEEVADEGDEAVAAEGDEEVADEGDEEVMEGDEPAESAEAADSGEEPKPKPKPTKQKEGNYGSMLPDRAYFPYLIPPYTSAILSPADIPFGLFLGPQIRKVLALTDDRPSEDNIPFNIEIIDKKFNHNYKNSINLLHTMKKKFPRVNDYFYVDKDGLECNADFCKKFGEGEHGFGICSPYICKCDATGAEGMKCKDGLVFDPIYVECSNPLTVKVCGF